MIEWIVTVAEDGLPLLDALQHRVPAAPQSFLRQLCKRQRVRHAGKPGRASAVVTAGDRVSISPSARLRDCISGSGLPPHWILHEDRHCIILAKPAGLIVHPAPGHEESLLGRLQTYLSLRGEKYRIAAVHRLDLGTSGPVLFGKGRAALQRLGQMFMAGEVTKGYLALVSGRPPREGILRSPVPARGRYRPALARFRHLGLTPRGSVLEISLRTGRHHQIRRQLADAGWPLVGDTRYGGVHADSLFLHSHLLAFRQPFSNQDIRICPPLPGAWAVLVDSLARPEGTAHEEKLLPIPTDIGIIER